LTATAAMFIKSVQKRKVTPLRTFVAKSLILVGRRTAAGG
jgi:hypothetical protein